MPKPLRIVIVIAIVAAGTALWYFNQRDTADRTHLVMSGNIEVTQVDLGFKIAGRLQERLVDEGQPVNAHQVIARLDPSDNVIKVSQAEAEVAYTRAVVAELEAGSRPEEIDQANAQLSQARAAAKVARSRLALAEKDLKRYEQLRDDKVISQRDFDQIQTQYKTALDALNEALAQVQKAQATKNLVRIGPRRETVDQARARLLVAQQALALAEQHLGDTVLKAPFAGVVLSKGAEPGAFLNPGSPVVTLGRMGRVWLRAYINQTDLGLIKLNQKVKVHTDTFADKTYPGRVSFISDQAEFTPRAVQTHEERVKLMYRVKIELDNPEGELKPGMPADAMLPIEP